MSEREEEEVEDKKRVKKYFNFTCEAFDLFKGHHQDAGSSKES